jgi:alpha-L-arabinofuranosidase
LERSVSKPLPLQEPDLSATLSADAQLLRIYSVNSTSRSITTRFDLTDFSTEVKEGVAYILEDRERGNTTEVMNSRDDPERVSLKSRKEPVHGRTFDFTFRPFTVTLLELSLSR